MPGSIDHSDLTDARLVAYLDGVLDSEDQTRLAAELAKDPALHERLELLRRGTRDFKAAFDPLLKAAPEARMQDMLSGLIKEAEQGHHAVSSQADNVVTLQPRRRSVLTNLAGLAAAAGIALAVFAGGVYTGWQTGGPIGEKPTQIGWRQAAAQYIALFNDQSFEGFADSETAKAAGLTRISQALDLDLTNDNTAINGLRFKGTQLLQLRGKPLAQIAYLDDNRTPIALCIVKSANSPYEPKTEQRLGLNIVHWVKGGHGFMLIGKVKEDELKKLAAPLVSRLS